MTREEMVEDLSYVRAMAEEGRHAPLLGGSFLLFWGALNAIAYLLQWTLLTGRWPAGENGGGFAVLWIGYGVVAATGSTLLSLRLREKPGRSAIGVRAERAIWRGVGIAIGVVAIGALARMFFEHNSQAPNGILGPAFALLGAALLATATMSGQKWLGVFAVLALLCGVAFGMFANVAPVYLAAAPASVLVLCVPGLMLLRHEPSAIV